MRATSYDAHVGKKTLRKVSLHSSIKRASVAVLIFIVLASSSCVPELLPTVLADEHTIDVSGTCYLSDGATPIAFAKVRIYHARWYWWDENLGETYTDVNGHFEIQVHNDNYDVYAEIVSENDAVRVRNNPTILFGSEYSYDSPTAKKVPDGPVNLGDHLNCPSDDDAGFQILRGVTLGWYFMLYGVGSGYRLPRVDAFYHDIGCPSTWGKPPNCYYYNGFVHKSGLSTAAGTGLELLLGPILGSIGWISEEVFSRGLEGIHIDETFQGDMGTILHEYGHYVMDQFGDFWPPYSVLSHIGNLAYDPETAWLEGWAHVFSSAARKWCSENSWTITPLSYYGLGSDSMSLTINNTLQGDSCEGAVAGALWDLLDQGVLTFGDLLNVECSYPSGLAHAHPWNINEFWEGCKLSYDTTHINQLWLSLYKHGIREPDDDMPNNPTSYRASENPGSAYSNPSQTITVKWYGAWDATSGIAGYSTVWDTSPDTVPPETHSSPSTQDTSPALSVGYNYYFHVRAVDNAGNWADDALHVGPFLRGGGTPKWSDLEVIPARDTIFDNESEDIIFRANWTDPSGISQVRCSIWGDSNLIFADSMTPVSVDANGNGEYAYDINKTYWLDFLFGHRVYWQCYASPKDGGPYRMTPRQVGPLIADNDVSGPSFADATSTGDVWDNDATWNSYNVSIRVYDPSGVWNVAFRYKVGEEDWSNWQWFGGRFSDMFQLFGIANFSIPRSELIKPTTYTDSPIWYQARAWDNDTDRDGPDMAESISPPLLAGIIRDDDVDPPRISQPSVDFVELPPNPHNPMGPTHALRAMIHVSDPRGISSVKFRIRLQEKDGWPADYTSPWMEANGSTVEMITVPGESQPFQDYSYWYELPLSSPNPAKMGTIVSYRAHRFYWQVSATDDDNDLLGDESTGISKEYVYAPPTTTLNIGLPSHGIYITSATPLSLEAHDYYGGTEIQSTAYRIFGASYSTGWLQYTGPFELVRLSDGSYSVEYNSTDKSGNIEPTETCTVILDNAPQPAELSLKPNLLNLLGNGTLISAYVELSKGYNVSDIIPETLQLNGTLGAESNPIEIADHDNDSIPDAKITLNRTAIAQFILSEGIKFGNVTLTINGQLQSGTMFESNYIIKVKMPGDVNMDGKVRIDDIFLAAQAWASTRGNPTSDLLAADENEDGRVRVDDVLLIALNYGKTYA
jgi:hypothetical protein